MKGETIVRMITALIVSFALLAGCGIQAVNEAGADEEPTNKEETQSAKEKENKNENKQTKQLYQFETMTFKLWNSDIIRGQFTVNLLNPAETYEIAEGVKVELLEYFPDYAHDGENPISRSPYHWNPAFIFQITDGDQMEILFSTTDRIWKAGEEHTMEVAVIDATTTTFEADVHDVRSTIEEVIEEKRDQLENK